jgi:acyl-CoA synthetase (AMP-forming)/AMP-acid ligase II
MVETAARTQVVLHALGCMVEHRLTCADVWGHVAPMFHLVDAYSIFAITWVGGSHVMVPAFVTVRDACCDLSGWGVAFSFSTTAVLSAIETKRITVTNMASSQLQLLLADPSLSHRDLSSLTLLSCGGAPLPRATALRAMSTFRCEFFLSYGMTECSGKIATSLLGPEERRLPPVEQLELVLSSGRPFLFTQVRVVNEAGQDVHTDGLETGEVWIRGDTCFDGYWNDNEV